MLDGILLERAGIPTASIVTAPFRVTGVEMAKQWGCGDYAFLEMVHPIANLSDAELDERADTMIEGVENLLLHGSPAR